MWMKVEMEMKVSNRCRRTLFHINYAVQGLQIAAWIWYSAYHSLPPVRYSHSPAYEILLFLAFWYMPLLLVCVSFQNISAVLIKTFLTVPILSAGFNIPLKLSVQRLDFFFNFSISEGFYFTFTAARMHFSFILTGPKFYVSFLCDSHIESQLSFKF